MQQRDNISMNILKEFWICEKCVTLAQHAAIEDTSSSYAATFRGSEVVVGGEVCNNLCSRAIKIVQSL